MTALYVLLFASPLQKEPIFKPVWVDNLSRPSPEASAAGQVVGFRMGKIFGYANPDGRIRFLDNAQFGVAMDGDRFINFSSVSQNLVMRDSSGRILSSVEALGYPILSSGRFFVINPDRTSLSEIGGQGIAKWNHEFGSLITCISSTKSLLVAGLLDGSISVLGADGKVLANYTPGGSRIAVIYGCAISPDGNRIGLISGLDPQRFILLDRTPSGFKFTKAFDLRTDFRSQAFIHFFPRVPYVYYEGSGGAGYISLRGGSMGTLPVPGTVRSMILGPGSFLYVASVENRGTAQRNDGYLSVISPPASLVATSRLPGNQLFLTSEAGSVYLGADQTFMRVDYADN